MTTALAAIAGIVASIEAARATMIDGQLNGSPPASGEWVVSLDTVEHRVLVEGETISVDGETIVVDAPYAPGQRLIEAIVDDVPLAVRVERTRRGWRF